MICKKYKKYETKNYKDKQSRMKSFCPKKGGTV